MFDVIPVKLLSDNFGYVIIDATSKQCAIVDGVEADKVLDVVNQLGGSVQFNLCTHSHWDHCPRELAGRLPESVPMVAGANDGIDICTLPAVDKQQILLGRDTLITVLDTPCHTPGHICFYVESKGNKENGAVFTGDTLFLGGSGNLNSGTPQQMYHALIQVLGSLPDKTQVYYGHNYSARNLRFGASLEPSNPNCQSKLAQVLSKGAEFCPTTIGEEKLHNPFMRLKELAHLYPDATDPSSVLLKVRQAKDLWGKTN